MALIASITWFQTLGCRPTEGTTDLSRISRAVASTPDGGVVDLSELLEWDWDEVVYCRAYSGSATDVNRKLGRNVFAETEFGSLSLPHDEDFRLAFLLDGEVRRIVLRGSWTRFSFRDVPTSILKRADARFRTQRENDWIYLLPVE